MEHFTQFAKAHSTLLPFYFKLLDDNVKWNQSNSNALIIIEQITWILMLIP